jgi:hypothetical protein
LISEKVRSRADVLFWTTRIMAYLALLGAASSQDTTYFLKLARFDFRRITQMHHFSGKYDKFLSYTGRAAATTVQG